LGPQPAAPLSRRKSCGISALSAMYRQVHLIDSSRDHFCHHSAMNSVSKRPIWYSNNSIHLLIVYNSSGLWIHVSFFFFCWRPALGSAYQLLRFYQDAANKQHPADHALVSFLEVYDLCWIYIYSFGWKIVAHAQLWFPGRLNIVEHCWRSISGSRSIFFTPRTVLLIRRRRITHPRTRHGRSDCNFAGADRGIGGTILATAILFSGCRPWRCRPWRGVVG
jgi:hypothetical protein